MSNQIWSLRTPVILRIKELRLERVWGQIEEDLELQGIRI
jgi:hypothetical protein